MKILIVEDEKELSESICLYLKGEQFICEQAFTYASAMEKVDLNDYACIVLDITLPDGNGLDILKDLKFEKKLDGVIIISAKNLLDDKVYGLKSGADDYLTKPFHLSELSARIHAVIRRKSFEGNNTIEFDNMELDLNMKSVSVEGCKVDLTRKEYELLLYFLSNKSKVISKNAIATHLWGDEMAMANNFDFIYTHIKNLRKKLTKAGTSDFIQSIYGMGYKLSLVK